jgi:hypothetical protein
MAGPMSFHRGTFTCRSHGRDAVGSWEYSRRNSPRRAKCAASANTTSSRMKSAGWNPSSRSRAPLVPGPVPKSSSSVASVTASASGPSTARRSGDASRSISDARTSSPRPATMPLTEEKKDIVSRSGSRSATRLMRPMPQSSRTTGSATGSPIVPRLRRSACAIQNAARRQSTAVTSRRRNASGVRTTTFSLRFARSPGERTGTPSSRGRCSSRDRSCT